MQSRRKLRNFFRFITSDLDHRSLKIPKKFTREHRKQILLNNVLLIVPGDDKVWHLGWTVSGDGKLWLQQGWPEFHQHYCLKFGHLLVFKLLGKSVFHVTIFSPRYREINYVMPTKCSELEEETDRSETRDMWLEKSAALHTASEKGEAEMSRNRALKSNRSFKSVNPFYSVTVTASYLQASLLYVPATFCSRHLTRNGKYGSCVLEISNGGRWGPVECRVYGRSYGRLCGRKWKKFSDDNHLRVGDECKFELIDDVERVMKVTITRACSKRCKKM